MDWNEDQESKAAGGWTDAESGGARDATRDWTDVDESKGIPFDEGKHRSIDDWKGSPDRKHSSADDWKESPEGKHRSIDDWKGSPDRKHSSADDWKSADLDSKGVDLDWNGEPWDRKGGSADWLETGASQDPADSRDAGGSKDASGWELVPDDWKDSVGSDEPDAKE